MSDNAIIAKAKAINGLRLNKDDYNNLIHKASISAVVAYLKTTPRFEFSLVGVSENSIHRGQLEMLLAKDVFGLYIRLCKFKADNNRGITGYLIKKYEIEQLLQAVVFIDSNVEAGYLKVMPTYLMEFMSFNLMDLANARNFAQLLDVIENTPYYAILKPLLSNGEADIETCGIALYCWYYRWVVNAISNGYSGKEANELRKLYTIKADYDNILTAFRMRRYFNIDSETIHKSLKPYHYRLTDATLNEILNSPNADTLLIQLLDKQYFKGKIPFEENNLEVAILRNNYQYFKKQLHLADSGAVIIYSLMSLLEAERTNIQKIIEGIRYGLEPAEIEKLLVI